MNLVFGPINSIQAQVEEVKTIVSKIYGDIQEVRDHGFAKRSSQEITADTRAEMSLLSEASANVGKKFAEIFQEIYQEAIDNELEESEEPEDKYGLGYADIDSRVSQSSPDDPLFGSRLNLAEHVEDFRSLFDLIDLIAQNTKVRAKLVNESRFPDKEEGESYESYAEKLSRAEFFSLQKVGLSLFQTIIEMPFTIIFYKLFKDAASLDVLKPLTEFGKELTDYMEEKKVQLVNAEKMID